MKLILFMFMIFFIGQARAMQDPSDFPADDLQTGQHAIRPEKKSPGESTIHMPVHDGHIFYEIITPMDSSAGKEALYKAALNWYMRTFPYAYKNLIIDDQAHGKILGRCSFQFPYSWLMEEYMMKADFTVEITVRYGKCRLRFYDIQPKDEIKAEENYGHHGASTWENRSLEIMYAQYLQDPAPPLFEKEKIGGIHHYFSGLLTSFRKSQHELTQFIREKDSF